MNARTIQILLCLSGLFLLTTANGQPSSVFTHAEFIDIVRTHHPVAKQALLLRKMGSATLLSARGAFDPSVQFDSDQKTFDGSSYYRYQHSSVSYASPLGVRLKAGVERADGGYINPERTRGVMSYVGIEVPLLNGLMIDKRRAVLQQARLFNDQSEEERKLMINDLLYDAHLSYLKWATAYQQYALISKYVEVARQRMRLVRITQQQGDRSLADTIEAYTQLQNYELQQQSALLTLNETRLELSFHLWDNETMATPLTDDQIPDTLLLNESMMIPDRQSILDSLVSAHPESRRLQLTIKSLEVEKRLKQQELLPSIQLNANLLSKDYLAIKGLGVPYLDNNHKFGIQMKVPLFMRQARGDYARAKLNLQEYNLTFDQKIWELHTRINQHYNEVDLTQEQIEITQGMINNLSFLLRTEELKFTQGESSLFLINSRESKLLEMEQKLTALRLKFLMAGYAVRWTAGQLQ